MIEKTHQAASRMKELQLSAAIDPHDLEVKLRFKGRQKAHKEVGFEVVNKFVREVALYGQPDSPPKLLGDRGLNVVLSPLARNKRAKHPREAGATDEAPEKADRSDGELGSYRTERLLPDSF